MVKSTATPAVSQSTSNQAAIRATNDAIDLAAAGASWANDRIGPMLEAIAALADISDLQGHQITKRVKLLRDIANEAGSLVDDMGGCFESEKQKLESTLVLLDGEGA